MRLKTLGFQNAGIRQQRQIGVARKRIVSDALKAPIFVMKREKNLVPPDQFKKKHCKIEWASIKDVRVCLNTGKYRETEAIPVDQPHGVQVCFPEESLLSVGI